jgi:hypothetical protein
VHVDEEFFALYVPDKQVRMQELRRSNFLGNYTLHPGEISYRLQVAMYLWALPTGSGYAIGLEQWHALLRGEIYEMDDRIETRVRPLIRQLCFQVVQRGRRSLSQLDDLAQVDHGRWPIHFVRGLWEQVIDVAESIPVMGIP